MAALIFLYSYILGSHRPYILIFLVPQVLYSYISSVLSTSQTIKPRQRRAPLRGALLSYNVSFSFISTTELWHRRGRKRFA